MTPDVYARVKDVFAQATELPVAQRADFVRQRCGDDEAVQREVLSLLEHHQAETIIDDPSLQATASDPIVVAPPQSVDPHLVLRDVWEDNRQILRRRLVVIAVVMSALIAMSLLRLFTYHYAAVGYGARVLALVVSVGCAWVLYTRRDLTLPQIRIAEFLVMANVGLLAIVIFARLMAAEAGEQDTANVISINNWSYFIWTLIILVYGVFMPNDWRRAAMVVIPLAMIPSGLTVVMYLSNPQVSEMLAEDSFGQPIPAPFVGACIAIYAAHLIHGARFAAFEARRLAQYRINRPIGEGAMGRVFEAEHLLLKRVCAIKLIQPEYCADDDALKRFAQEVQATARLTHPHTIDVYDYGQTKDGVFFYAMELLPGMNLQELVQTEGPLPPSRAVHFLSEVCESLDEAHRAGLIHRDVKPANIFATQRGGINDFTKLLDFGVVKELHVDRRLGGKTNMVAGTPGFMSPEQISEPTEVDARADIYGVGAVGFFLLTGRPPFVGGSAMEVMLAQVDQTPEPPSTYRADIPGDLELVIMQCLSNQADRRPESARRLLRQLQKCECFGVWTQDDATNWWHERPAAKSPG